MSSQYVNFDNKNTPVEHTIDNSIRESIPCTVANHLSSPHHVRHHSYDTTAKTLATQIFPSPRSNRKEDKINNTNQNSHLRFLPSRPSHRHTASYLSDQSPFTNSKTDYYYYQHHYSASQENLRSNSDVDSSLLTSISRKKTISSTIQLSSSSSSATTTPSTSANSLIHSSSSNSSTILNRFNIHNAKLIGLLLFFALLFYHGSQRYVKGATSCHRLLNEGRIERYHVWQPTGCMIHWYDLLDFNQCTRLITQSSSTIDKCLIAIRKAFNNRIDPGEWLRTRKQEQERLKQEKQDKRKINFSYTFVGDERLYMIYRTFINTIKYHSNLSRKKTTTIHNKIDNNFKQHRSYPFIYKHAKNLTYINENFILNYYSIQTFNDYLYNLLHSWIINSTVRPHILILGFGLHDALRDNASIETIKYFESNLTRIKQNLLINLSLTTTIFWFGQPHLSLNNHLFQLFHHSFYHQSEFFMELIPKLNSYIDRMNSIARRVFHHTNIYWHSSSLLEEYSSLSNENTFLYDDNNDKYFVTDYVDDDNDDEPTNNSENNDSTHSSLSTTAISNTLMSNLSLSSQSDLDTNSINQTEIVYYSYVTLRKYYSTSSTILMINSGKIYEFYKLSSFTRHTCVQMLLNALCNPLLLPDDGTCCAQVPPLTRLQFLISLILGCSITFFIIYVVYRIRSVFILKRKRSTKLIYEKRPNQFEQQQQDKHPIANGHCLTNGIFNRDDNENTDEAGQQLLSSNMNDDGSST